MSSKGGGSTPDYPDPNVTAKAQAKYNKETALYNALLNNVNQITPYGSITYSRTGAGTSVPSAVTQSTATTGGTGQYLSKDGRILSVSNGKVSGGEGLGYGVSQSLRTAASRGDNATIETLLKGQGYTPYGSTGSSSASGSTGSTSSGTGSDASMFTSEIKLSPEMQAIFDRQTGQQVQSLDIGQGLLDQAGKNYANPYDLSGIGDQYTYADAAAAQKAAEDAIYSRIDPQFSRDEEALRTRLINQGIGQGSEAYNREMEAFNKAKTDARYQAVLQGANYAGTMQDQALQRRNQGINEYTTTRNSPLNEYQAITGGVQVTNPTFSSGGTGASAAPVDYTGLVNNQYNAALGASNAQQASSNNTMSGLFNLGGSFLGSNAGSSWLASLSDIRAKKNLTLVGHEKGLPVYEFEYNDLTDAPKGRFRGVMAQDVEKIMPEAVQERDGWKTVNYGMLGMTMEQVNG